MLLTVEQTCRSSQPENPLAKLQPLHSLQNEVKLSRYIGHVASKSMEMAVITTTLP